MGHFDGESRRKARKTTAKEIVVGQNPGLDWARDKSATTYNSRKFQKKSRRAIQS